MVGNIFKNVWTLTLVLSLPSSLSFASDDDTNDISSYKTLNVDGQPWKFNPLPNGIVAIGDIHADFNALVQILISRDIIDRTGALIAENLDVVINGDIPNRGPDGRLTIDFLMDLKLQGRNRNVRFHMQYGNHEVEMAWGEFYYSSSGQLAEFCAHPGALDSIRENETLRIQEGGSRAAFSGHTKYAAWLSNRNSIIKIGRNLFVHGGLDEWILNHNPGRINASIRAWVLYGLGLLSLPDLQTVWTIGRKYEEGGNFEDEDGPLWNRKMARGNLSPALVRKIRRRLGVDRIFLAHTRYTDYAADQDTILNGKDRIRHRYGGSVYLLDTGISVAYDGVPSSVYIQGNRVQGRHVQRDKTDSVLKAQLLRKYADPAVKIQPFLDGLTHENPRVRAESVYVLSRIIPGDPRFRSQLIPALHDDEAIVRREAIRAIKYLGDTRPSIQNNLAALLQVEARDSLRISISEFLARANSKSSLAHHGLIATLEHPNPEVRLAAALALIQLRPDNIFELMKETLPEAKRDKLLGQFNGEPWKYINDLFLQCNREIKAQQ